MTTKTKALFQAALTLPPKDRAALAETLLESLNGTADADLIGMDDRVLEAAVKEADKEWRAFKRGQIAATPAREFVHSLRKRKKP